LAKEEAQINEHNKEYYEGKTLSLEKLSPYSDEPDSIFSKKMLGLRPPNYRSFSSPLGAKLTTWGRVFQWGSN
jgi:hypothetical protein